MENEKIKVEVISEKKLKYLKLKARIREKARDGYEWVKNNKETIAIIGTGAYAAANGLRKMHSTRLENEKRLEYYDPHTGMHWQLKRRLTNDERAELMMRQRSGEYTEDILRDMRVLK